MTNDEEDLKNTETLNVDAKEKKERNRSGRLILISAAILFVLLAIGAAAGYQGGINLRMKNYQDQVAIAASVQYQYGLIDLEESRYDFAQQRFEYVISLDPNFPGAVEKLQEAMLKTSLDTKPTVQAIMPTVEPTPEIQVTATPDNRNEEEVMESAEQEMLAGNWTAAIGHLDQLRLSNRSFQTAKVDGMYYLAYRNLGVQQILYEGNLEGGMYDLSIAERFGPLDVEANSYRTYARYYVTGASFWELDWGQVNYYFSLVSQALPNLVDGSGYTAAERYRISAFHYGDNLFEAREFCSAQVQYEAAYAMNSEEEGLWEKVEKSREKCEEHGNLSEKDN